MPTDGDHAVGEAVDRLKLNFAVRQDSFNDPAASRRGLLRRMRDVVP